MYKKINIAKMSVEDILDYERGIVPSEMTNQSKIAINKTISRYSRELDASIKILEKPASYLLEPITTDISRIHVEDAHKINMAAFDVVQDVIQLTRDYGNMNIKLLYQMSAGISITQEKLTNDQSFSSAIEKAHEIILLYEARRSDLTYGDAFVNEHRDDIVKFKKDISILCGLIDKTAPNALVSRRLQLELWYPLTDSITSVVHRIFLPIWQRISHYPNIDIKILYECLDMSEEVIAKNIQSAMQYLYNYTPLKICSNTLQTHTTAREYDLHYVDLDKSFLRFLPAVIDDFVSEIVRKQLNADINKENGNRWHARAIDTLKQPDSKIVERCSEDAILADTIVRKYYKE